MEKKRPNKYRFGDFLEYIAVIQNAPRPLFRPFRRPKRKHSSLLAFWGLITPLIFVVLLGIAELTQLIKGQLDDFPSFNLILMAFFFAITLMIASDFYLDFREDRIKFLKQGFFQSKPKKWKAYFKSSIKSKNFWKMPKE